MTLHLSYNAIRIYFTQASLRHGNKKFPTPSMKDAKCDSPRYTMSYLSVAIVIQKAEAPYRPMQFVIRARVILQNPAYRSFHAPHQMSWVVNSIKSAFGTRPAPTAANEANAGPEASFPEDVPFDDSDPCSACANPCSTHKQIPDYLKIDMESPLVGSIKPYRRHILFQTPGQVPNSWQPRLDEKEGTLAFELSGAATAASEQLGHRILVTAVDTREHQQAAAAVPLLAPDEVLILPDMVALGPLTVETAKSALVEFLVSGKAAAGTTARQLGPWQQPGAGAAEAGPWAACILVCAHKLRDKRCGVAAPLIMDELRAEGQKQGLQDKIAIMGCSHIGGHKFAGNLIVYGATGGHWYGRVKACHAEAIINTHVLQGKVIKELWRGRMDVQTP